MSPMIKISSSYVLSLLSTCCFVLTSIMSSQVSAETNKAIPALKQASSTQLPSTQSLPSAKSQLSKVSPVDQLCKEIGYTLGSVNTKQCIRMNMQATEGLSVQDRPLAIKEYAPVEGVEPLGRVLVMGGIHGDEYSSVSLMFRWMETLNKYHSGAFHWQMVPLLNPDGLMKKPKATRQNANGVDLNRNFPTFDWGDLAQKYWVTKTYKNPRRYPGPIAASEPETIWFMKQIQAFQPEVIIAVHAPHRLVDFDGPRQPPVKLGQLELRRLGTYPGSLGNYGAHSLLLPVVTVELASAGIMPSKKEIRGMWMDLVRWLKTEVPKQRQVILERQKRIDAEKARRAQETAQIKEPKELVITAAKTVQES